MERKMQIILQYDGALTDKHVIDFYDVAKGLAGFQRTLSLITHLALHGEIITQAPALKGAQILTTPSEVGSWKQAALIAAGGIFTLGSVGKDSPVGHIVTSLYDFALYETMGFHPDYDKTLQQQYKEYLDSKKINRSKMDSLIEKVEPSIVDMHRPIISSKTASSAKVFNKNSTGYHQIGPDMTVITYEYLSESIVDRKEEVFSGLVSSYNINTYKGRFFVFDEKRPISFELDESSRRKSFTNLITASLRLNDANRGDPRATLKLTGKRVSSRNGRLKRVLVSSVQPG